MAKIVKNANFKLKVVCLGVCSWGGGGEERERIYKDMSRGGH